MLWAPHLKPSSCAGRIWPCCKAVAQFLFGGLFGVMVLLCREGKAVFQGRKAQALAVDGSGSKEHAPHEK